jgi:preprotein translocase subunit SecE
VAARNRRRARDRRARPAQDTAGLTADGLEATPAAVDEAAGASAPPAAADPAGEEPGGLDAAGEEAPPEAGDLEHAPEPLDHAAPDVELADAQVMLGAAGFVQERDEGSTEYDRIYADEIPATAGGRGGGGAGELAAPAVVAPERPGIVSRLTNFLRGSWRELQRVQWPDRRQVMQATGVVLGFVIVAGVYLGVADFISQKVVHFILTK